MDGGISNFFLGQGLLGVTTLVLGGVVIYQEKAKQKLSQRIDEIQAQRLQDARETRDRLAEQMVEQTKLSEKIYELLVNRARRV